MPVDGSLAASVFGEKELIAGGEAAAQIYRAVNERMPYDKPIGKPWGRGDARWA